MRKRHYIAKPELLIVDDDASVAESLETILEGSFRCQTAGSAEGAIKILARKNFSVALVDILLPGKDGISLLERIKKEWPVTEVIMVTAVKELKQAKRCMKAGAFDYLTKPWKVDEMVRVVGHAAEKSDLERKLRTTQFKLTENLTQVSPERSAGKALDLKLRKQVERLLDEAMTSRRGSPRSGRLRERFEAVSIMKALAKLDWNQSQVAKALNMPRNTLIKKMKRYRIPTVRQPRNYKRK